MRLNRKTIAGAVLTAVASLVAVGAVAAPGAQAAEPRVAACPNTAVFETDGYGHGESMTNWKNSEFNANPPAGVEIVPVPYYAGIFPGVDKQTLDESVAAGAAKLETAVRDFHSACPGAQLTLSGYSEGAVVAGDTLENLAAASDIPHDKINGVLYGNPRRDFGDGGRGGVAGGMETNLPTVLPGVTMKGGQKFGDIAVHNVCNENDGICNSTNMITNLAAFANGLVGYAQGDHGYSLNPIRDAGNGVTLHPQEPKVPYGAPLPLPVGTPWQIQELLGGAEARAAVATARNGLTALVGPDVLAELDKSPWFQLVKAA